MSLWPGGIVKRGPAEWEQVVRRLGRAEFLSEPLRVTGKNAEQFIVHRDLPTRAR